MKTWKTNLEETKQRYINWWNHKGIILSMIPPIYITLFRFF